MVAVMRDPGIWRQPGCDVRCHLRAVIERGAMQSTDIEIHDPAAHEAFGVRVAGGRSTGSFTTGLLTVNFDTESVVRDGATLPLTMFQWLVMKLLASKPGRVFSHDEISLALYGRGIGIPADMNNVRCTVYRLKCALTDCGYLIENRAGAGWRLLAEEAGSFRGHDWRWSQQYDCCSRCGGKNSEHTSGGICSVCYRRRSAPGFRQFKETRVPAARGTPATQLNREAQHGN